MRGIEEAKEAREKAKIEKLQKDEWDGLLADANGLLHMVCFACLRLYLGCVVADVNGLLSLFYNYVNIWFKILTSQQILITGATDETSPHLEAGCHHVHDKDM